MNNDVGIAKKRIKKAYADKWQQYQDVPTIPAVALDVSESDNKEQLLAFLESPFGVIRVKPDMLKLKKSDMRHVVLHELAHFWQDIIYPKDKAIHGKRFREICKALKCKYPNRYIPV